MTYEDKHLGIIEFNRTPPKVVIKQSEATIHEAIARYLEIVIKPPSIWHTVEVSNQAKGRAAMIRQMGLKRRGVKTGFPDIEIFHKTSKESLTQMVFLEVKSLGEDTTPKQKEVHALLKECGHTIEIVRSIDDVARVLKKCNVV